MTKKKKQDSIWYSSDAAEKVRIREFWLQLSEDDRKGLVKLEKEAVLKKMKEQQRSNCSCNVCGRKKSVIEEELEILYDAYYEELEHFANDQKKKSNNNTSDDIKSSGILHVADDFLKNDGQKFLCLMEELASQRLKVMEEEGDKEGIESDEEDWDDVYDEEEESDGYDEEDEEESIGEQQRMAEGRRMFQIFAAKMFEQRVLTAYREKVAQERQRRLLEELEEEEKAKKGAKLEKEKKKAAKKALKKQKEEEKLKHLQKDDHESFFKEQQEKASIEAERKRLALEEEEKSRLLEIKKQEEALAIKLAKEEAERREAKELMQKKIAKEQLLQKKKAQEQLLQKEREQAKLRIQKEAEEKAKEDRKKEKDEKIKAAKRERKERKARERFERESVNLSMKSAISDKGSSSSLHISSVESESVPHSPSLKDHVSYSSNIHNVFRVDNSIHSPQLANAFSMQRIPVNSESHQVPSNQQSTKNPPGLTPSVSLDSGLAFSPLSYGLSLQSQDHNAMGAPAHSALNPLGFMGQPNSIPSLSALGPEHSHSGLSLPINRNSAPNNRSKNRPPGIQGPELSPLYVDEAATLRLSGLYDEADELISCSPGASNDLLSGINKAPSSTWNSLMGNSNQFGSNPLANPHIWSQRNPPLSSTTNVRPPSSMPPNVLTHEQFVQMQTAGTFSVPSPLPGFSGISPISMAIPGNQPIGQTDGAWSTNRFFDQTL